MEYTYDDIITAKDILTGKVKKEDIIGKKGWLFNNLPADLDPNTLYRIESPRLLSSINAKADYPFICSTGFYYFLPEKEESAPEESYEERQAEWVKANNIKVGDKVRVADKWNDDGLRLRVTTMDPLLGKVLEVRSVLSVGISLWTPDKGDSWYWPYTMLEKVEDKLPDDIHELDISVFSSLETIWEIDRSLCPRIKGYTVNDSGEFIAFDNTAGEFFVEDFNTREKAISWLNGTGTKEEAEAKDKPEYVPFDLSDKKVRDELRGKWIIPKGHSDSIEKQITLFGSQMTEYGKIWCVDMDITPDKLLDSWTFLDGTPCGQQIASK